MKLFENRFSIPEMSPFAIEVTSSQGLGKESQYPDAPDEQYLYF